MGQHLLSHLPSQYPIYQRFKRTLVEPRLSNINFLIKGINSLETSNYLNSILFYLAFPERQGHDNNIFPLPWALITYPTLSTFPTRGNRSTRTKHTMSGLSSSHHFATEAPSRTVASFSIYRNCNCCVVVS